MDTDRFGRKSATGGTPIPQYRLGDRRRGSADWSQDLLRVKQLRVDSSVKREAEAERDGHRGRRSIAQLVRADKSGENRGRRKESREGRQRQRRELKLQLEETRGKLLELQRKVWQVYGEHHVEEEKTGEGDGVMDETDMLSEGEADDHLGNELYPPLGTNEKNPKSTATSEVFPETPVDLDLDMELDGGGVWLGCSLVQGEWENVGGGEKFAQALKQELSSAVARVIDRVLHLYAETDQTPPSTTVLEQEISTSRALDPNSDKKQMPGVAANLTEQAEALPLVAKRPQEKRSPLVQGRHKNLLIPQANSSLPLLPQPHLSALLPPRNKDSFLPSCPPNPPPLPLPLLHYTMQHLFTRSLSSMPLHKDGLSNEPFMDFRSHNPSFPPLPLLGQLNPPLSDRGRDEGMRVGIDGGDTALYLGPGAISFFNNKQNKRLHFSFLRIGKI